MKICIGMIIILVGRYLFAFVLDRCCRKDIQYDFTSMNEQVYLYWYSSGSS